MLNLEDKTALKVLAVNTYNNCIRTNSDEVIDHLNLRKVGMTKPNFCL